MEGLNKKLSEQLDRKIDQLESSSLKYLFSLCFLLISLKTLITLDPYETTVITVTIFWIALSIDLDKRIYIYLPTILSSAYLINQKAFLLGIFFAVFLVISGRIFENYMVERNFFLFLAGILTHIGDIYTTSLGLQTGLSEQNPFLNYIGDFGSVSSGLVLSKTALFFITGFLYKREFENLNPVLKIFVVSGFFLTLANLDVILSGS